MDWTIVASINRGLLFNSISRYKNARFGALFEAQGSAKPKAFVVLVPDIKFQNIFQLKVKPKEIRKKVFLELFSRQFWNKAFLQYCQVEKHI